MGFKFSLILENLRFSFVRGVQRFIDYVLFTVMLLIVMLVIVPLAIYIIVGAIAISPIAILLLGIYFLTIRLQNFNET